ncbi:hypothetical protein MZD04_gp130 [Pseudomonas phage Psa21]|uniref:Uncharacterized protein n=1 Tax=Pseudomonas phage Psa21 TaxID=2530023 RepID=A0A481W5X0_9CAUD|nr:hypothetical protein MZD04_gp130 [Pseudomonas phage Psa21]QBJ02657.1 hypothetical protein PSA21_130 [Pseudomonas phage Psa21]
MNALKYLALGAAAGAIMGTGISLVREGVRVTVNGREVDKLVVTGVGVGMTTVGFCVALQTIVSALKK